MNDLTWVMRTLVTSDKGEKWGLENHPDWHLLYITGGIHSPIEYVFGLGDPPTSDPAPSDPPETYDDAYIRGIKTGEAMRTGLANRIDVLTRLLTEVHPEHPQPDICPACTALGRTTTWCGVRLAWIDATCQEQLPCSRHGDECHTKGCTNPPTHECEFAGQFVCGYPLCDECVHDPADGHRRKNVD